MAEGKKTFVLHSKLWHTAKVMNDEDAGALFKHILQYVNDLDPETDNPFVALAFAGVEAQLKEDLEKWRERCEVNSENGRKGGRPRVNAETKPKKPNGLIRNRKKPIKGDNEYEYDNEKKKEKIYKKVLGIEERKKAFKEAVIKCQTDKFDIPLLQDFFIYWSEHGENDKKMRWEKEKTFGMNARLHTFWKFREQRKIKKDRL